MENTKLTIAEAVEHLRNGGAIERDADIGNLLSIILLKAYPEDASKTGEPRKYYYSDSSHKEYWDCGSKTRKPTILLSQITPATETQTENNMNNSTNVKRNFTVAGSFFPSETPTSKDNLQVEAQTDNDAYFQDCESCQVRLHEGSMIEGKQWFCKPCFKELSKDDEFMGRTPTPQVESVEEASEKLWDDYSRYVPHTVYSEEEIAWVIGKNVMLKQDFLDAIKQSQPNTSALEAEWIKIESDDDLPQDENTVEYWVFDDDEIVSGSFMHDSKRWYHGENLNLRLFPTHYQPIIKPNPPTK